jgi:hypothetical protein
VDPGEATYRLEVPAEAPAGATVRVFVGAVGQRLLASEEEQADLRLAATELLGAAVDAGLGGFRLEVGRSGETIELRAGGLLSLGSDGPIDRRAMLRALCDDVRAEGDDTILTFRPSGAV